MHERRCKYMCRRQNRATVELTFSAKRIYEYNFIGVMLYCSNHSLTGLTNPRELRDSPAIPRIFFTGLRVHPLSPGSTARQKTHQQHSKRTPLMSRSAQAALAQSKFGPLIPSRRASCPVWPHLAAEGSKIVDLEHLRPKPHLVEVYSLSPSESCCDFNR